jgi:uncharacterized protein YigE (DUF2233 family)
MRLKPFVFALLAVLAAGVPARAQELCQPDTYEAALYTVCTVDLASMDLALYAADTDGSPYGSFASLAAALAGEGKQLIFAMNAGMFDDKLKPIGLYIENGWRIKKANTRDGYGNFHMKPNGVFYIAGREAGVMETQAFLRSGIAPDYATQSGPMLVIDGAIHPKFSPDSTSFKRRNGVGVIDGHKAVFVISEDAVTFYAFAKLFAERLGAQNALFFDGTVSSLFYGNRSDNFFQIGPIVAVTRPQ